MTNVTAEDIRKSLRSIYLLSIIIGNLPKHPEFDGKVLLLDDVEVSRIEFDLRKVSDTLVKVLQQTEQSSVKPQILDATIHEATVPAYELQQANCLHANLMLDIHRILNDEPTLCGFDEIQSIADFGNRRFEEGKSSGLKSATELSIEGVAKLVYQTWHLMPGYVSWQNRGNSNMQEKARDVARKMFEDGK